LTQAFLLRRAVEARIAARDHPVIEERDEAAGQVGLMLQQVVRERLAEVIPRDASLDGVKELSADINGANRVAFYLIAANRDRMLPVEAELNIQPGAASAVSVGGEDSIFDIPTGERQFVRRMEAVRWTHRLVLQLP
jgi:hypothetical protein